MEDQPPGTRRCASPGAAGSAARRPATRSTLAARARVSSPAPFNWSHKAIAGLDERVDGDAWTMNASHDGSVTRFGLRHHRTIRRHGDKITIADRLSGDTSQEAEIVFQLAPGPTTSASGATIAIRRQNRRLLRIAFPSADFAITSGEPPEAGGWVSEHFGSKTPAPRIAWHGRVGESAGPHRSSPRSSGPLDTPRPET